MKSSIKLLNVILCSRVMARQGIHEKQSRPLSKVVYWAKK